MDSKLYFKVTPKWIGNLAFIFQSYDNLAIFTTLDRVNGIIVLRTDHLNIPEIESLLKSLKKQYPIEILKNYKE